MKKVDFDDYAKNYNQLLNEETSFFSANEEYFARYKVDLVRKQSHSPVHRLLEYGCGIGRNIPFLKEAFPNAVIVGSDISKASLEIARQENPGFDFFQEDENVGFTDPFDLIFVAGVFHHIPFVQREDVAKILFNRLSPGGLLFVFEHNPFNPVTRHIVSNCPFDEDANLIKPSELQRILGKAALTVIRKAYCLFFPPRISILTRLEGRMSWLPFGGQYWMQAQHPF